MQTLGVCSHAVEIEPSGQQPADHGAHFDVGRDATSTREVDAADCDKGHSGCSSRPGGSTKTVETRNGLGIRLGRGLENRSERDVVGAELESASELDLAMGGDADAKRRSKSTHVRDVEVALSHVHSIALREHGEIRSIVREEQHATLGTRRTQLAEPSQNVASVRPFGTKLHDGGSCQNDVRCERHRRDTAALQKIDVDDGIKPAHSSELYRGSSRSPTPATARLLASCD